MVSKRVLHPPADQLDRLRQPLTPGERAVARLFHRALPPRWEIYLQPHLNGLRPAIVLLNPDVGIAVFEIKDWNLDAMSFSVGPDREGRPALFGMKDGQRLLVRNNPVQQVNRYKRHIYELYCPRLKARSGFAAITAGVIMPCADGDRARALLGPFLEPRHPEYQPVSGREALANGDLRAIFPEAFRTGSRLMSEQLAADLRGWLIEPDISSEQRRPLMDDMDAGQRQLASDRTVSGYRRIRGPAGSGKSLVLAARAARLADEGKEVLVVSFNITLSKYLRDLTLRGIARRGASERIVFTHFHGWCRAMCEEARLEQRLGSIYAKLPAIDPWMSKDQQRLLKQQRAALQHVIDDDELPELVIKAVERTGGHRYDAILVDEGQDFRPAWWNALRTALRGGGEMVLVADATQDIYGTARAWTDEAMTGAGFPGGRWAQLSVSYRLPPTALTAARRFAERFLPPDSIDLPEPERGMLPLYPSHLRWVQCTPDDALACCVAETLALMEHTGRAGLANADITILADNVAFGGKVVERLAADCGIATLQTFAQDVGERRRQKMGFFKGSERIKATTLHSFKGWESRLLVVHVEQAADRQGMALVYAALTRLKRSTEGSWLTVVCSAPELADYGESWSGTDQ